MTAEQKDEIQKIRQYLKASKTLTDSPLYVDYLNKQKAGYTYKIQLYRNFPGGYAELYRFLEREGISGFVDAKASYGIVKKYTNVE